MRKTKTFKGKKHVYDTEKSTELGHRDFGSYGDPTGYEETLYQNRGGFYFLAGRRGLPLRPGRRPQAHLPGGGKGLAGPGVG